MTASNVDHPAPDCQYILRRGFDPELALRYGLSEVIRGARRLLRIEYRDRKGNPSYRKYRTVEGEKTFFREPAGVESHLWGIESLYDPALVDEAVVICESETDAMSAIQCGWPVALATGGGAGSEDMIRPHIDEIRRRRVILATDNDTAGEKAFHQLAAWIGMEYCYHLYWDQAEPATDLNACLQFSETELKALLGSAESCIKDGFTSFDDLPPRPPREGLALPWQDLDRFTIAKGEMTIMTGIPGHGKSLFARTVAAHMAEVHGWKIALISLEDDGIEKVLPHLRRFHGATATSDWLRRHYKVIDAVTLLRSNAMPTLDFVMERMTVTARAWAADMYILDPWSRLAHDVGKYETETQYIGRSINRLQNFSKLNMAHIWINAHPGKNVGQKKAEDVSLYDIMGSSHWFNFTDNGLNIWRKSDIDTEVGIKVLKNRWDGARQTAKLWWREGEGRYHGFEQEYPAHGSWE